MRIYNPKDSTLSIPISGIQRISIAPYSVSGDILPSNDLLSLLVTSFDYSELAIIVSGAFEINLCASIPCVAGFVVQSLDEAIQRFNSEESKDTIMVNSANVGNKSNCDKFEVNTCSCDSKVTERVTIKTTNKKKDKEIEVDQEEIEEVNTED